MASPAASLHDVSVHLGGTPILENITCSIARGELTAIIGPNGAGKSTLLRALLSTVPLSSGRIELHVPRRKVGFVPQRIDVDRTLPLSVEGFLAALVGAKPLMFGVGSASRAKVRTMLERVASAELATRPLGGLSGGEMQRVMLAAALEPEPELLILDEPASGMDISAEACLYDVVKRLVAKGAAVVMVSHDLSVVSEQTSHVLCINRKLVCQGGPQDILTDKTIRDVFGHGHGVYVHGGHSGTHEHSHSHDHAHDHGHSHKH